MFVYIGIMNFNELIRLLKNGKLVENIIFYMKNIALLVDLYSSRNKTRRLPYEHMLINMLLLNYKPEQWRIQKKF